MSSWVVRRSRHEHDLGRDPRDLPGVLRAARPQAPAVGVARAGDVRRVGPAHDRGHAPAQGLLPGPRDAARAAAHELPEVLSHDRHRERRQHRAAPHVLRDARQLLDRRLLQGGRGRVRLGAVAERLRLQAREDIWITVFEGDDELGLGPGRGGDRGLGGGRRPARADRPVPALGELLAGRPDRSVRPVQRALPRPRRRVRHAPTTCPAARTSASWSTGTSSSCSTTRTRRAS